MKRFVSFLLSALLAVGMLPLSLLSASAVTEISALATGLNEPVSGDNATFTCTLEEGERFSFVRVYWAEVETAPTGIDDVDAIENWYYMYDELVFDSAKLYVALITLYTADGYAFASDFSATVNGEAASFVYVDASKTYANIYRYFGSPVNEISDIAVSGVTEPVVGETASFDYTLPEGANYTGFEPAWYVTETMPYDHVDVVYGDGYYEDSSLIFEEGYYYTFIVAINASEGYCFSDGLTATVNGASAEIDDYYTAKDVYFTFYLPGPTETVESITAGGVTAPAVGEEAAFSAILESIDFSGSVMTNWVELETAPTSIEDVQSAEWYYMTKPLTFKENKYYALLLVVTLEEGYSFGAELSATVNGLDATYTKVVSDTSAMVCYDFGRLTPSVKLGDIDANGEVNASDYSLLKRFVLGTFAFTDAQLAASDINGDERYDSADYTLLKRAVLGTYTIG